MFRAEQVSAVPWRGRVCANTVADVRQDSVSGGVRVRSTAGPVPVTTLLPQAVLRQEK